MKNDREMEITGDMYENRICTNFTEQENLIVPLVIGNIFEHITKMLTLIKY